MPSSRKRVKRGDHIPNIPNDVIITNIVSRLTAKDVMRCCCVCKSWKDMTSTHSFKELHMRRAFPLILAHNIFNRYRIKPFLHSKWWELSQVKKVKIQRLPNYPTDGSMILVDDGFSQDGLIVFKTPTSAYYYSREFVIFNPTYGEHVTVVVAKTLVKSDIYAVFYHPRLNEYCTIWRMSSSVSGRVTYKMLNLGSELCWRQINSNHLSHNITMVKGSFPIYVNDSIYWLVDDGTSVTKYIMVFEIRTERLSLIPCPTCVKSCLYKVRLVNIDGDPCLIHISNFCGSSRAMDIQLWTLKDEENNQCWTSSVSVAICDEGISFSSPKILEPIAVVDGILAFHNRTRIFLCNLKLGTITKYGREMYYRLNVVFWPHITSLVSLRNCQPLIDIEDPDDI